MKKIWAFIQHFYLVCQTATDLDPSQIPLEPQQAIVNCCDNIFRFFALDVAKILTFFFSFCSVVYLPCNLQKISTSTCFQILIKLHEYVVRVATCRLYSFQIEREKPCDYARKNTTRRLSGS